MDLPAERPIRVILADDDPDLLEYLRVLLDLEGFEVAGLANDTDAAVHLVDVHRPDVALLDLRMPGGGLEAARLIGSVCPTTRIVMFTGETDTREVLPLLRAGIDGYVVKGGPVDQIIGAIRTAIGGGAYLSPDVNRLAIGELTSRLEAEEQDLRRRDRTQGRIEDVIAGERFEPVVQPIIDLRSGTPRGAEALTRFTAAPQHSPLEWFEAADTVGLRPSLELATARTALAELHALQPDLYLTVNISPATALTGRLGEVLVGVELTRVVLELTEHARVDDYAALGAALAPWRRAGVRVAVDDAGGGYASFAHILSLSPDFIKLDISLVRDIDIDIQRQALARAVAGFAAELGVTVIAEGIETAAELEVIASLGTPLAQGFHLGRPRPLAEQTDLVRERHAIDLRASAPIRDDHGLTG